MIWTIIGILLLVWLLGTLFNFGGNLLYTLLVVAVVLVIVNLITGRRAVT